ncbi:MAG: alpha/beta hydrolase [Caulobacterales bacterium RIFCSPHIGHO2_01_FULL_70_19]|nr:MAG: alpha/beta hydrolase [Caulobacterales bacterium RIFCSPHIGHO2_01_FULL_70_19]
MDGETRLFGGQPVFLCPAEGAPIASEADAVDLIGGLWGQGADWLALPVARLGEGFLRLRTGIAGAVIQKFVTYQVRLAIVGDISMEMAGSDALRDFVRESNAGDRVWFVPDLPSLESRLSAR